MVFALHIAGCQSNRLSALLPVPVSNDIQNKFSLSLESSSMAWSQTALKWKPWKTKFLFIYSTFASWAEGAHWISGLQLGNVTTITVVLAEKTFTKACGGLATQVKCQVVTINSFVVTTAAFLKIIIFFKIIILKSLKIREAFMLHRGRLITSSSLG